MVSVDLLHKLVLGHSLGRVIYLPALILEGLNSLRADIFKEKELKAFVFHRMKDFWLTDVHGGATAPVPEPIVENRSRGGDGDGYHRGRRSGGHSDIPRLRHFVEVRVWKKI